MKFGSKVIFLVRDPIGFGTSLFDALRPIHPSTRELSSFEVPSLGEKYGIVGRQTVTVEIAQFFAPDGSPETSVFLLSNLQPPTAVCAINELLVLLSADCCSYPQTVIIPYHIAAGKLKYNLMTPSDVWKAAIFGIEIGSSTIVAHAMLDGIPKPPSALQIHCELLNWLMHLMQVYKMSGILLVGTGTGNQQQRSVADQAHEVLLELGQFLANHVGLLFASEMAHLKHVEQQATIVQEPWRAIYG